jgi:hypothetical protein
MKLTTRALREVVNFGMITFYLLRRLHIRLMDECQLRAQYEARYDYPANACSVESDTLPRVQRRGPARLVPCLSVLASGGGRT